MANIIRHVRRRSNGVFYYERRVPQCVVDQPAAFDALFGGQQLYRVSLGTRAQTEAMRKAIVIAGTFESRVRDALGGAPQRMSTRTSLPAREVTDLVLAKIMRAQRDSVARPFRAQLISREVSVEGSEEYERMIDEFEQEAAHISAVFLVTCSPEM